MIKYFHLGAQCNQCVIPFSGERCEKLATCDENLCHNGGTCTTTSQADSQLGLIDNLWKVHIALK